MSDALYRFRLYVAGDSPNSQLARVNLAEIVSEKLGGRSVIEVIDVLKEPLRALSDKVLLTPTLVMVSSEPPRRLVGSLSEREKVLSFLRS
jgi:circadian clock protein KaiB